MIKNIGMYKGVQNGELADAVIGLFAVIIFLVVDVVSSAKNNVVMDVSFVNVRGHDIDLDSERGTPQGNGASHRTMPLELLFKTINAKLRGIINTMV